MNHPRTVAMAMAIAGLATVSAPAAAQMESLGNRLGGAYFMEAIPGHTEQFEAGMERYARWYEEAGGSMTWEAFGIAMGERSGQYLIWAGGRTYADFDAQDVDAAESAAMWNEHVAPHMASMRAQFLHHMPDLSIGDNVGAPIYEVLTFQLRSAGGEAAMEQLMGAIRTSLEGMEGIRYSVFRGAQGAPMGQWLVSIPYDNFSGMDGAGGGGMEGMFSNAFDDFHARSLAELWDETVASGHSEVLVRRPDLSAN